jgi:hypothetical protein
MKEYLAAHLIEVHQKFLLCQTESFKLDKAGSKKSPHIRRNIRLNLEFISNHAELLGLRSTRQGALRLHGEILKIPLDHLQHSIHHLTLRFHDDLVGFVFFYLAADKREHYQKTVPLGEVGQSKFPTANLEVIEAGNCYAFERYAACVFHLMRACEVGVKALYKTLGLAAPKLADSWGNLLRPMDEELKKNPKDRCKAWAAESEFFDNATNDVRAIKRAWRDSTMHVQSPYDESSSLKVLNAVTSFFVHLSNKIDEEGNLT